MLKLTRRLLVLTILCAVLFVVTSTPGVSVQARSCQSCFTACDQEWEACEEWGLGCPYPNEGEIYISQSYWFMAWGINCASYAAGDCYAAFRLCSNTCAENCN